MKQQYVKVEDCELNSSAMKKFNKNMENLIGILNHRVTRLEQSVAWIKWIMTYMAVVVTASALLGGFKFLFI